MIKHLKILIVEDQLLIANYIKNLLKFEGVNFVDIATNTKDAFKKIENFQPDILLLDINIDGQFYGISLASNKTDCSKVIYITAQNDEATIKKAIQTNPVSYLTKPIKKSDLMAAIQLAILKLENNTINFKNGPNEVKLNHADILFVKSDGNYIDIQTQNEKYTIRMSLDKFYNQLNNPNFIKTHRSYIINTTHINHKTASIVYILEYEIPLSRKYKFNLYE